MSFLELHLVEINLILIFLSILSDLIVLYILKRFFERFRVRFSGNFEAYIGYLKTFFFKRN